MAADQEHDEEEYIIEFISLGNTVKVTACDPKTMKEVSIVGAPKAGREKLAKLATRKLKYVLARQKKKGAP